MTPTSFEPSTEIGRFLLKPLSPDLTLQSVELDIDTGFAFSSGVDVGLIKDEQIELLSLADQAEAASLIERSSLRRG